MKQTLYRMTHNKTGLKYLGQTTQDINIYNGSGVYWTRHLAKHGENISKEVLFESDDKELFELVAHEWSVQLDVVEDETYANLIEEHGGSLGGKANPNYKDGRFTGRHDDPELYKALDAEKHKQGWEEKRIHDTHRQNYRYHKEQGHKDQAKECWDLWYANHPFKDERNPQSLWSTDTFDLWWSLPGGRMTRAHREKFKKTTTFSDLFE